MQHKKFLWLLAGVHLTAFTVPATAQDADSALQDVIIVNGTLVDTTTELSVTPETLPLQGNDITHLTARTPGGARIGNGELSGQMQYRGLFGERLNLRVDGQRFASGGPNLMDPVFHYAPSPLIASIKIDRGISPVSEGPGLAGGADAVFKRIDYEEGPNTRFGYDVSIGTRSVNESLSTGGVIGAASDTWRINLLGAWEDGGDTRFANGSIGGTAFSRGVFGLSAGTQTDIGEFTLDVRRQNTEPSGNPPFPMDIQYFDTDFLSLGYSHDMGGLQLKAGFHKTDVAHLMDNFSDRPAPMPMRQRATYADANTQGGDISVGFKVLDGDLLLGADIEQVDHNVTITNPNNSRFFVTPFPEIDTRRIGGFAQWRGRLGIINSELGLRADRHKYEAEVAIAGPALPMGPQSLAQIFNGSSRAGDETTIDGAARLWTDSRGGVSWRATLARKQKMPGYIQRFGWLPINASGGLADGNIYVGDQNLEPETAWIAEAGFDYMGRTAYLRPTFFLREIENYIQGVPFDATIGIVDTPVEMISAMNGDSTPLRWDNVDARLYGFDLDGGYDFDGPLRLDGVLSYVRGVRRDIDDDLYRISPPNLTLGLTWETDGWSATLEARAVARQNDVSLSNDEQSSESYAVANLYGNWEIKDGIRLSAGVENLLNENYTDHLSGVNRNGFGDVPIGEKIPGAGRGVFLRLNLIR